MTDTRCTAPFHDLEASIELADAHLHTRQQLFARMRDEREAMNVTTEELAEYLGVDAETVAAIEAGDLDISLNDLGEYLTGIGASIHFNVFPRWKEEHRANTQNRQVVSHLDSLWRRHPSTPIGAARRAVAH